MGNVAPFPTPGQQAPQQTVFNRAELSRIMDLYGRMVAAGHWRDYAIDMHRDEAIFSAFRRAAERRRAGPRRAGAAGGQPRVDPA